MVLSTMLNPELATNSAIYFVKLSHLGTSRSVAVYNGIPIQDLQSLLGAVFVGLSAPVIGFASTPKDEKDTIYFPLSILSHHPSFFLSTSTYSIVTQSVPDTSLHPGSIASHSLSSLEATTAFPGSYHSPSNIFPPAESIGVQRLHPSKKKKLDHPSTPSPSKVESKSEALDEVHTITVQKLLIGSWEAKSSPRLPVTAVFNTTQKTLSWEIGHGSGETLKIESGFDQIRTMHRRDSLTHDRTPSLDITLEMSERPRFYRMAPVKDKENVDNSAQCGRWTASTDFTVEQASKFRRHIVKVVDTEAKKLEEVFKAVPQFKDMMEGAGSGGTFSFFSSSDDLVFPPSSQDEANAKGIKK